MHSKKYTGLWCFCVVLFAGCGGDLRMNSQENSGWGVSEPEPTPFSTLETGVYRVSLRNIESTCIPKLNDQIDRFEEWPPEFLSVSVVNRSVGDWSIRFELIVLRRYYVLYKRYSETIYFREEGVGGDVGEIEYGEKFARIEGNGGICGTVNRQEKNWHFLIESPGTFAVDVTTEFGEDELERCFDIQENTGNMSTLLPSGACRENYRIVYELVETCPQDDCEVNIIENCPDDPMAGTNPCTYEVGEPACLCDE